ncbi:hypothetical protein COU60_02225 [Candidatus Pacearchaeota archaeon CG10_big_fil_rev_8_21_14_0_10_34_76]|nr:MAG: hypothetical protein COU60_02225 [Candidatus Pacearchaeota archaeon CG10_big_fil_rev_8_21_14_0_10_34_76]
MEIIREVGSKGQVVIPKDIRKLLGIKEKDKIIFEIKNNEVKIKKDNPQEFLDNFFSIIKKKKSITLDDIKRIEDESYDIY